MRIALILLALTLIATGYRLTRHQAKLASVAVKLPPARAATPRPGFRV
jgi:hypothetical protein